MWPFHRRKRAATLVRSPEQESGSRFNWQQDRKYLADAPYLLPKDLQEGSRLDFQHYVIRYALHGNYAAPLDHPQSILDVGTGTGRWAREMAQFFPQANVIGVDVVQPTVDEQSDRTGYELRPENYSYVTGSVLDGLPFGDRTFEYVHQRLLFLAIPADRWPAVARELARVTRPGGWVELVESGLLTNAGPETERLEGWGNALGRGRNVDMRVTPEIGQFLHGAGLAPVEERTFQIPLGRWGGRLGQMMAQNIVAAFTAIRPAILGMQLASAEEIDATLAALPAEWEQRHSSTPFYVTWGRRTQA